MDALTALQTRSSANLLDIPGPTPDQLENLIKAATRACDHKGLKPWKFIVIEGEARAAFGKLMAKVKTISDGKKLDAELETKLNNKALRAPTIIAVAATIQEHEKVPAIEQVLSAGAAAQMIMVAAHAQGLGAIWRSGSLMFSPEMLKGLKLESSDQLVGFIYIGTPKITKPVTETNIDDFIIHWDG